MYGWRARIGLILAHSNTVMEPSFNRIKPNGVSIHAARIRMKDVDEPFMAMKDGLMGAVEDVAHLDASSYAYACTAATFVGGLDHDRETVRQIREATGRPAVTAAMAVQQALRVIGAKRLAVATPYSTELTADLGRFLESTGFEVASLVNYKRTQIEAKPPYTEGAASHPGLEMPGFAYKIGREAFRAADGKVDALLISAAGIRSLDVVQALETDLGVPVVTSSQAIIWAALHAAGVRERIPGHGRLLSQYDWSEDL